MPAVDEIGVQGIATSTSQEDIRRMVSAAFWDWFASHQDQKVTTVNFWFIHKTVYVRDLRDLFVLLFGEPS